MKLEREAVSDSVKEETDLLSNDDDGGNGSSGEQREVGSGGGGDGHRGGGAPVLKKGPWTAAEDKILIDYVNKNGEGNWNQVQKNSGLFRCGKSCRLRWANHLRPNLKKGQFSEEEENLIIQLHAKMGNKWAQMATHLPGRTDNEIKNFWNTRTKRCQRSGKPIYPDELRVPNEDLHCQSPSEFCGKKRPNEFSQGNGFDLPQVIFENFNYELPLSDISVCNLLGRTILASNYLSINHPPKRLAVTDSLIAGFGCSVSGNHFPNQSEKIPTFATDFDHQIYDFDPGRTKNVAVPFSSFIASGHPNLNGNFSTSGPMMNSVKMELPSFQYDHNDPCSNWYDGPAGSPIEQIDTCLQSPASSASVLPGCISQQNNRLFDELVHKGQELGGTTKSQGSMEASVPTRAHDPMLQNVEFSVSEEQLGGNNEFGCNIDHSSASVLCECPIGSSSVEEFQPPKSPSSWNDPLASTEHFTDTKIKANSLSSQPDFLRPDALPGSSLLNESSRELKDQYIDDTLAALFHGDPYDDYKPLSAGDLAGSGLQLGVESFPWRNMPRACHMSEFPQNHDGNC